MYPTLIAYSLVAENVVTVLEGDTLCIEFGLGLGFELVYGCILLVC